MFFWPSLSNPVSAAVETQFLAAGPAQTVQQTHKWLFSDPLGLVDISAAPAEAAKVT